MDPIGLALENFDGIGRWRTTDGGAPIDASEHAVGRHEGQRPGGAAAGDPEPARAVRPDGDRDAA